MPRIIPLQLLRCLRVLLDSNGGILSGAEVKRIAGLMTKYSKKLVSKCIYVQILKATKTELLGEFMEVGGWSLVYTWLSDAIRAMNWPLVQEILELLLLCPVDVHRLKINAAPKVVKSLCRDGGNEGVRILAKRLVDQWLKIVTENSAQIKSAAAAKNASLATTGEQKPIISTQSAAPVVSAVQPSSSKLVPVASLESPAQNQGKMAPMSISTPANKRQNAEKSKSTFETEQDPLADVSIDPTDTTNYSLTNAQKKANEKGLVYKIVVRDGQQVLAKVSKPAVSSADTENEQNQEKDVCEEDEKTDNNSILEREEDSDCIEEDEAADEVDAVVAAKSDKTNAHLDKKLRVLSDKKERKESDSISSEDVENYSLEGKSSNDAKLLNEKDKSEKKEHKSSKDSKDRKERSKDGEKDHKSSSSSSHRSSSSSHKSSSKSSSSSSSKSKSSSSSSSHRSSSSKHRSDKDRSSSSSSKDKDKERDHKEASSSSKHRSSSKSSSSSSSSKDRSRDKDKDRNSITSSSSSSSRKEKDEKDKDAVSKDTSSSEIKLGKIPKKPSIDGAESDTASKKTPQSITIPSKKASMSIEIRPESEKAKTVKTYKSQFRSHGLNVEAPPPPSRKGLKKPSTTPTPGAIIPVSLPSAIKRSSPPPRDSPTEKKVKIDITSVPAGSEKPGAIKLIPPKKIQTLVETNLFSDALSAATGPKKTIKRKRSNTPCPSGKEAPSPPTSPESINVQPMKFYQETMNAADEELKSDKDNEKANVKESDDANKENSIDDDEDIPLKKVKDSIDEQAKANQSCDADSIVICSDAEEEKNESKIDIAETEEEIKKPGPGCGPNGPPGVLMLHRRKGPKKKLKWRPQEQLEEVRYFELDENERVNVTKSSFGDMKTMEHFNERDAINALSRRHYNHEDNMEPQTHWRPLYEVDDVPPHPMGSGSKQRLIQAEREMTTLRALYFSPAMIPDSASEAEIEPQFAHDIPIIPFDDITGNPDAVNDFTSMKWPEPRTDSPKHGDTGSNGLNLNGDLFGNLSPNDGAFKAFGVPFGPNGVNMNGPPMSGNAQNVWPGPLHNGPMPMGGPVNAVMNNHYMPGGNGSPNMEMAGGPMVPPHNFMGPSGQFGPNQQFGPPGGPPYGVPPGFNGPNFGPMGPMGQGPPMMNGMGSQGPMAPGPHMMNGVNNRNNRNNGNWRTGGNFVDNNVGGGNLNNWRPAGPGPIRGNSNKNSGVCKAFMRGHCRLGKSCKFIHPKTNRI